MNKPAHNSCSQDWGIWCNVRFYSHVTDHLFFGVLSLTIALHMLSSVPAIAAMKTRDKPHALLYFCCGKAWKHCLLHLCCLLAGAGEGIRTGIYIYIFCNLFVLFCYRHVTILKEHELLISVYSQYTTYQKETKKKLQFTKHYSE